jgi:hypothetical protein
MLWYTGQGITCNNGPNCGCALSRSTPVLITSLNCSKVIPAGRPFSSGVRFREVKGTEWHSSSQIIFRIELLGLTGAYDGQL